MMKRLCLRAFACLILAGLSVSILFHPESSVSAQQQTGSPAASTITTEDDHVWLNVTVMNKRRKFLTGLSQSDFNVTDNKKPVAISSFSVGDAPQSIGIIFDLSGSMVDTKMLWPAVEGVRDFLRGSNEENEYFLLSFNEQPQVVVDWTKNRDTLLDTMRPKKGGPGQTAFYDALYLGIEKVKTGRYRQRSLIVISDGQDNASVYSYREVLELLKESNVTLYSVSLPNENAGSPTAMESASILDGLSSLTGGEHFPAESKKKLPEVFRFMAEQLRYKYRISFKPATETGKRKWHQLKVTVNLPPGSSSEFKNPIIKSREGYYPNVSQR